MSMRDQILDALGDVPALSDAELAAAAAWITANMDDLPYLVKEGLLKLINAESHRRL